MSVRTSAAPARRVSAEEAAAVVRSGDWVDYGAVLSQPDAFDRALAARKDELTQVKIRSCITTRPRAVLEADPEGEHFYWFSLHMSGYDRAKADAGRASYLPVNLGEIPDYYRRFIDPVDVLVIKTCPIDEDGYFNLGPANLWHRSIAERARLVIVEETPGLPYAYGEDNALHLSEVDLIIAGDDGPPPLLANPPATEADAAVARLIAAEVLDGSCLQIGIGAMPNAVCSLLLDSGVTDLGVHSEMLTDGIIDLYRAGKITGARKTLQPGRIGYSFALGGQPLYDAIDRNRDLVCLPVERTNLPHVVAQNDRVVSINSTTAVDLTGQAASESDGHRQISGTGGQLQFVRGAYASHEGTSFMCLTSTYDRKGERKSRIVLDHKPGTVITTPRTDVMCVVTEFGLVNLKGKSVPERARALISIAHPDFREGLERQAYENRLIPRGLTL